MLFRSTKTHGYNGTLVLVSDQQLDNVLECLDEVHVLIDGLQVPFPVKESMLLTETSAHLSLEFVDNQNEALELVGCEVYAIFDIRSREIDAGLEQWIGYVVADVNNGDIGIIQSIENYNGNMVIQVMDGDKETLISLYPELVVNVDNHAKILHIAAPDGYFDHADD